MEDFLGKKYINHYYDKITLSLYNTSKFNIDSTMELTIASLGFATSWPGGIVYGDVINSEPCLTCLYTKLFDFNETPISVNDYNNVIKSKTLYFLPGYTFYLAKGVGIVRVDYNNNDSINSLTLIDYSLN